MPPTPVRIVTNSGVYVCGGFEPIMIDIVVLHPGIIGGDDRARMSGRIWFFRKVKRARQFKNLHSSCDDKKRTTDRDHIFEKGDRKIVPSDRYYQPFAKLVAA